MNIVGMGRSLLRLQYQAASMPLRLVERDLIGRYLGAESAAHLAAERAVAVLDVAAGRLLADEALREQGARRLDRSDALDVATRLEQDAERRRTEADRRLSEEAEEAEHRRVAARENQQQRVAEALREQQADAAAVSAQARDKAAEDKRKADEQARALQERARREQQAREERAESRAEQATAAPKQELAAAAEAKADAQREERGAEQLGQLADRERAERRDDPKPM